MKLIKFILAAVIIFLPTKLLAADLTIEMLNKLEKESMVFSQKIAKIDVGDTIFWKSFGR